ncbi:MAG: hypothetical protein Q8J69_09895 [Sphingobacteriaceae bacterium]|nr:hypothetical protein [Sphingobacteriaceae bacterium]
MKKLVLFILVITASMTASAQSMETTLGRNYWGIRQGFTPTSYRLYNGVLYSGPREMNMQLDFIYGFRLNRSFYLESGLTYFNSQGATTYSRINYNGIAGEFRNNTTHALLIPVGVRYRSGGEKWRFTANVQILAAGGSLVRYRTRRINYEGQTVQSASGYSRGLGLNITPHLGAGFEYQLAPQWTFRGEVNVLVSPSILQANPSFGPGFHLGLFKTISQGKKF